MNITTTVTVGSGKAIHAGSDCGTLCGAAHRNGFFTQPKEVKAEAVTCKRCIRILAAKIEEAHAEALNENAQRTWDAERAEDLAPASENYPAAVALNTWLAEGLVLVGPATDSLYVFQSWQGGTAVLRHVDTGATEYVAQSDIVNWRYLPGVVAEDMDAALVISGHVVKFDEHGQFRTVARTTRHSGTDLISYELEGTVLEYVRKRGDQVKVLVMPAR